MKKFVCLVIIAVIMLSGCSASAETKNDNSTQSSANSSQENNEIEELKKELFTTGDKFPQLEEPKNGEEIVVLTTNMGVIKIKLCPEEAPEAVENFKGLVEKGYYNGIKFHRVLNDFMVQGGDPDGNGTGGESIWGEDFKDELKGDMYHFRGALAYANRGMDTNGSQFYIVQSPNIQEGYFEYIDEIVKQYGDSEILSDNTSGKIIRVNYSDKAIENYNSLGGTPFLDFGYTVFGQVFEGMEVVDSIAAVETKESSNGEKSVPVSDVIIEKAEIAIYNKL